MHFDRLKRRQFITLIGGATAWPLAVRAQQGSRMPGVGVLLAETDDRGMQERLAGLRQGLNRLGWSDGRNIRMVYRFCEGKPDRFQPLAKELVAMQPSLIVAQTPLVVEAVRQETDVIPIVFVDVSDPIGPGFVASLARPGGNLTGLLTFEAGIVGKWLAMLKEIAPGLARVALVGNSKTTAFDYFLRAAMDAAPSLGIEMMPEQVETASDIERVVQTVGRISDSGLIFPPDTTTVLHRDLVIALAARHRLPAVYPFRFFVTAGGLMSYSTDFVFVYRQAASYIDRILRGAKPADIPVQAPTKFETVLNLKTAMALGLTVPPGLLVAADEVIE
jgi:putative tryptophan/tyrosine transport system substrate-binding protein